MEDMIGLILQSCCADRCC